MTFLPIVDRELRVAARRKSTHRIRLWTTVGGALVNVFFLIFMRILGGFGGFGNAGGILFGILSWYTFGMCLLAGIFLAADVLSEEKRDGTLGLLFLTDLKGYDVVLGKFMGIGLATAYALVAIFPVMAFPLLMGGVTPGEFWRVALALLNALFFSLAVGFWVSSWCRESSKAMAGAMAALFLITLGPYILEQVRSSLNWPNGWWYLLSPSPFNPFSYGFAAVYPYAAGRYWWSLLASHLLGWVFLILAGWILPGAWQDRPFRPRSPVQIPKDFPTLNMARRFGARKSRFLGINPVFWLASGNPAMAWGAWAAVALCGLVTAPFVVTAFTARDPVVLSWVGYLTKFCGLLLKFFVAMQACRFFAEARRSGALELLLCTPLTSQEIIRGQWQALKRLFFWPIVLLAGIELAFLLPYVISFNSLFGQALKGLPASTPASGFLWAFEVLPICNNALKLALDFYALGWFGMWLALTTKKPNLAVAFTALFVLVLPSFVFCVPDFLIDIGFIIWARIKLIEDFRVLAAQSYSSAPVALPAGPGPGIPPTSPK
jgi:ABC-type transport system involved in cytochrome c biogenesis permease component